MNCWRASWSMVGRWLVYVPNPEGGEEQISLPASMKAEAHIFSAGLAMLEALEQISASCPPYTGDYDLNSALSDFGGNGDDYAREMEAIVAAGTGDIARRAIARATGAS